MHQTQLNTRYYALFLSFSSLLFGFLVIIGWHLRLDSFIQTTPQVVPMVYNSGICFILSGLSLAIINYSNRWLYFSCLCSLLLFCINILTLSQYIFAINLNIDNLIVSPHNLTLQIHPGRMAPNTTIAFLFVSLGLFCLSQKKQNKTSLLLSFLCSFCIISFALICLFSYLANTPSLLFWKQFTSMAPNTAIGFLLLSFCLVMTIYNIADRYRIIIQNWSPYLITICTLICVILLWSALKIQTIYGSDEKANLAAYYIKEHIKFSLDSKIQALVLFENHWKNQANISSDLWEANANALVTATPKLETIAWMDKKYVIQHLASEQKTPWLKSNNLKKIDLLPQHNSLVIKPILSPKGENGLMIIIPSHTSKQQGFILGIINFTSLLAPILATEMLKNYEVHISINNEPSFDKGLTTKNDVSMVALDFTLYDQKWKIETGIPTSTAKEDNQAITSDAIIILGLILSFVLFYTLKNAQIARLRLREIQKIQAFSSRAQQLAQLGGWQRQWSWIKYGVWIYQSI
ncbi:MAG: hypothetical protein AB7D28_10895 [Candidatus Berkiella sp.]